MGLDPDLLKPYASAQPPQSAWPLLREINARTTNADLALSISNRIGTIFIQGDGNPSYQPFTYADTQTGFRIAQFFRDLTAGNTPREEAGAILKAYTGLLAKTYHLHCVPELAALDKQIKSTRKEQARLNNKFGDAVLRLADNTAQVTTLQKQRRQMRAIADALDATYLGLALAVVRAWTPTPRLSAHDFYGPNKGSGSMQPRT